MSMQFAPRALPAQVSLLTQFATSMAVGVSVGRHRFRPQAEAMDGASKHAFRLRREDMPPDRVLNTTEHYPQKQFLQE